MIYFTVVLNIVIDMEYTVVSQPEACTRVQINGLPNISLSPTKIGSVTKAE